MIIFLALLSFSMQVSKCHYWVTVWFTGCFCAILLLSYSKAKYLYAGARTCQTPPHTTAYVRYCHLAVFSPQRHTGPSSAEEGAQLHHLFLNFTSLKVIRVERCEIHGSRGVTRLLLTVCYQAAMMSSLIAHPAKSTGSSLVLLDRSGGPHHFQAPLAGWYMGVSFQGFPWCVRTITVDLYRLEYRKMNLAWFKIYLIWVIRIILTEMEPFPSTPTWCPTLPPVGHKNIMHLSYVAKILYSSLHSSRILSP